MPRPMTVATTFYWKCSRGHYSIKVEQQGFTTILRKGVTVEVNQVVTLNLTLQVGQTKEVVEVTSEAPLVDTTSTQLGAVVNDRSISQLPLNARDTYQFLQLQPGVMSTVGSSNSVVYGNDKAGAVSVNGGRGRSNNFSVNGGDANDQFVNLPTVQPAPDSIRGVSRSDQYLRRRIWPQFRLGRQRRYKVGNQRDSRQRV